MSHIVQDARALLRMFRQSDARDMHVRVGDFAMFMAKQNGGANPLKQRAVAQPSVAAVAAPVAAAVPRTNMLTAPHIASLVSALPVGTAVEAGQILARLELLGEFIDLAAEGPGFVEAVFANELELLEYAAPILKLVLH